MLELTSEGQLKSVVQEQAMPDGIVVDPAGRRMFWTSMGVPGKQDGAIYSANLDGTDVMTIVPFGSINTPKQITIQSSSETLYFCDREGTSVFRCNKDGSHLERLIDLRQHGTREHNESNWCVGVAVFASLGKFYWTQKGPSKGGNGRIFSASIPLPGHPAKDVECLLENLPEPIDLELDEQSRVLYWTDRGDLPFGNSLNRIQLDRLGGSTGKDNHEVLARQLHEAIGLKLDLVERRAYVADLGGSIYCFDMDTGTKTTLFVDERRSFAGITLA